MPHSRIPSFKGIEAFLVLAEAGGLRAAARRLNLSVSAVSHRLRLLEDEVGTRLYERGGGKLVLTPPAVQFHEDLQPIRHALLAATARLSERGEVRAISVAATSVIISYWLAGRIGKWQRMNPGIRIEIRTIDSDESDQSDIVIRSVLNDEPEADEFKLFGWELSPICRPEVIERFALREPADLLRVPLIDVKQSFGGWAAWLDAAGLQAEMRERDLIMDSHDLMIDAASRGLGAAIGALDMMEDYSNQGLVMPFTLTCSIPGGGYVNGPRPGETQLTAKFRTWLMEEAGRQAAPAGNRSA